MKRPSILFEFKEMAQPVSLPPLSYTPPPPSLLPQNNDVASLRENFPPLSPEEQSLLAKELTPLKDLLAPLHVLPEGMSLESMELVGGDAVYLLWKIGYLPRLIPGFPKLDIPNDRDVRIKIRYEGGRARDLEALQKLFGKADREVFIDTGFNTFCMLQFERVELIMGFAFQRESLFGGEVGIPLLPFLESVETAITPRGLDESTLEDVKTHWVDRKLEVTKPRNLNHWGFFRLISKMSKGWTSEKELVATLLKTAQNWWGNRDVASITRNIAHTLTHHHSDDVSTRKAYYFNFCVLSERKDIWNETFGVGSLPLEQLNALLSVIAALRGKSSVSIGKDLFHPTLSLESALPILAENMTVELFSALIELCPSDPIALQTDPALLADPSPYVRYLGGLCSADRKRHVTRHVLSVLKTAVAEKSVREKVEAMLGEALPESPCGLDWAKWMIPRGDSDADVFAVWQEAPSDISSTWKFALSHVNTRPELVQRMVGSLPGEQPVVQLGALLSLASKRLGDAVFISGLSQRACALLELPFECSTEARTKLVKGIMKLATHVDPKTASLLIQGLREKFPHVNALLSIAAALGSKFQPTLPLEEALSEVAKMDDGLVHAFMKYGACDEAAATAWLEARSSVKASWQFAASYVETRPELVAAMVLVLPEDKDPYLQLGGLLTVAGKCKSDAGFISRLIYRANLLLKQPFSCAKEQTDLLVKGIKKLVTLVNGAVGIELLETLQEKFSTDVTADRSSYRLRCAARSEDAASALKQYHTLLTETQVDHLLVLLESDPEMTLFAQLVGRISPIDEARGERLVAILKKISTPQGIDFTGFFDLSENLCVELLEVIIAHELPLPATEEAAQFWVRGTTNDTQWKAAKTNKLTAFPCFVPTLLEVANRESSVATDLMTRDLLPEHKKKLDLQIEKLGKNFPGTAEEFFAFYRKVYAYDKTIASQLQSRAALYCKDFNAGLAAITTLLSTWNGDRAPLQSVFAPVMRVLIPENPAPCEKLMKRYAKDLSSQPDVWITLLSERIKWPLFDWLESEKLLPAAKRWEAWQIMVANFQTVRLVQEYAHAFKELEIQYPGLGVGFYLMAVVKGCKENDPSLLSNLCVVQDDFRRRYSPPVFPLAGSLSKEQINKSDTCFMYKPGLDVRTMDYPTLRSHLTSGSVRMIPSSSEANQHCLEVAEIALICTLLKASHPSAEQRLRNFLERPQLASIWCQMAPIIHHLAMRSDLDDVLEKLLKLVKCSEVKNLPLAQIIPLLLKRFEPIVVMHVCTGGFQKANFPGWQPLRTLFDALWQQELTSPESDWGKNANAMIALFNVLSHFYQDKIDANRQWHLDIFYYSSLATSRTLDKEKLPTACEIFKSGIGWYEELPEERLAKALMAICLSLARFGIADPFTSGFIWLKGRLKPEHLAIWKEQFWGFASSYQGEGKEEVEKLKADWETRPRVQEFEARVPTPTRTGRHVVFVPMSAFKPIGEVAQTFEELDAQTGRLLEALPSDPE